MKVLPRKICLPSIFQAVVNQTISGLACGKPIRGHVAFLGGPLHFLSELKAAFIRTLNLDDEHAITPENSHLFAAIGSALNLQGKSNHALSYGKKPSSEGIKMEFEVERMEPSVCQDQEDYDAFVERHRAAPCQVRRLSSLSGQLLFWVSMPVPPPPRSLWWARTDPLLYSFYSATTEVRLKTAIRSHEGDLRSFPEGVEIVRSCSTGYGEALMKAALMLDDGEVETVAHYYAAAFFDPERRLYLRHRRSGYEMHQDQESDGRQRTVK